MPGSWDVTPHNNNKNPSARLRPAARHIMSSRSLGRDSAPGEIPRDYSRGSVFTNHSGRCWRVSGSSSREEERAPSSSALLPLSTSDVHRPSRPAVRRAPPPARSVHPGADIPLSASRCPPSSHSPAFAAYPNVPPSQGRTYATPGTLAPPLVRYAPLANKLHPVCANARRRRAWDLAFSRARTNRFRVELILSIFDNEHLDGTCLCVFREHRRQHP